MRHDTIASFLQKNCWPKLSLTEVLHPGDDIGHIGLYCLWPHSQTLYPLRILHRIVGHY